MGRVAGVVLNREVFADFLVAIYFKVAKIPTLIDLMLINKPKLLTQLQTNWNQFSQLGNHDIIFAAFECDMEQIYLKTRFANEFKTIGQELLLGTWSWFDRDIREAPLMSDIAFRRWRSTRRIRMARHIEQ